MTIVYFDYVQRSCSSLYRLPRFINCPTYITLHYIPSLMTSPLVSTIMRRRSMYDVNWVLACRLLRLVRPIVGLVHVFCCFNYVTVDEKTDLISMLKRCCWVSTRWYYFHLLNQWCFSIKRATVNRRIWTLSRMLSTAPTYYKLPCNPRIVSPAQQHSVTAKPVSTRTACTV